MTNAVRHAQANELYVDLSLTDNELTAIISNNGALPHKEISEGGGLSSLRARIESKGGTMCIRTLKCFALSVTIPIKEEVTV